MPLVSCPFETQRIVYPAGILTEVIAPRDCQSLTVGNATVGDVQLATDAAGAGYEVIETGRERIIWLPQPTSGMFHRQQIACWILSVAGGTVVLTWA